MSNGWSGRATTCCCWHEPNLGLSGRWHPTFLSAVLHQSTTVQSFAEVNIGFSLELQPTSPKRRIASLMPSNWGYASLILSLEEAPWKLSPKCGAHHPTYRGSSRTSWLELGYDADAAAVAEQVRRLDIGLPVEDEFRSFALGSESASPAQTRPAPGAHSLQAEVSRCLTCYKILDPDQ